MISRFIPVAFLVALSASSAACGSSPPPQAATASDAHVDSSAAKKLVAEGARLIDVRGPDEFAVGHIDGAVNEPAETIGESDIGAKDTKMVLYCNTGARSARAATTLRAKGYTRVYELGPMSNWDK